MIRIETGEGEHSLFKVLEREGRTIYEVLAPGIRMYAETRCYHGDPSPLASDEGVALCDSCAEDVLSLGRMAADINFSELPDYDRGCADTVIGIMAREVERHAHAFRAAGVPISVGVEHICKYIRDVVTHIAAIVRKIDTNKQFAAIVESSLKDVEL